MPHRLTGEKQDSPAPPTHERVRKGLRELALAEQIQEIAQPLCDGHCVRAGESRQSSRIDRLGELAKYRRNVAQVSGRRGEADQIESGRLRG